MWVLQLTVIKLTVKQHSVICKNCEGQTAFSQRCKEASVQVCSFVAKLEYLISWCPGFPRDTVAVKELICGLVEMQESHQFWHTGLRYGVISCSLWAIQIHMKII